MIILSRTAVRNIRAHEGRRHRGAPIRRRHRQDRFPGGWSLRRFRQHLRRGRHSERRGHSRHTIRVLRAEERGEYARGRQARVDRQDSYLTKETMATGQAAGAPAGLVREPERHTSPIGTGREKTPGCDSPSATENSGKSGIHS